MKKLFVVLVLCCSLFFVAGVVMAEESYLGEVSLGYSTFESDSDYDIEFNTYILTGNVYLSKVATEGHPLAEAAFMERVGSIQFSLWNMEADSQFSEGEFNHLLLDASYLNPEFPLAFYAMAGKGEGESKNKLPFNFKIDSDSVLYGAGMGVFIIDGFEVGLRYQKSEHDYSSDSVSVYDSEYEYTTAFTKFVHELPGQMAFNLEATIAKIKSKDDDPADSTETNDEYSIDGDFYFTQEISLGAGFYRKKGDDKADEGDTRRIDFNMFITPKIAFGIGGSKFDAENKGEDDDNTLETNFKVRF